MFKKSSISRLIFSSCLLLGTWSLSHAEEPDIESIYNKYLEGDYTGAKKELDSLIESTHDIKIYSDLKEKLGTRALMELSQNMHLQRQMEVFNALAWQYERNQFRTPRRIKFFLRSYLEDDSTRHKSVPNLTLAGQYSVPYIIEHLKSTEDDIDKRSLCFQILLQMGSEAIAPLLAATNSKDTILLVNIIRILGRSLDPRAIPYLLKLRDYSTDPIIQEELNLVIPNFDIPEGMTTSRAFINESIRYLKKDREVHLESIASDGLIWSWDIEKNQLVSINPIKIDFEYRPQLSHSIWHIFKAESILTHIDIPDNLPKFEKDNLIAALTCVFSYQEYTITGLLKGANKSAIENIEMKLKSYLQSRSERLKALHWLGQDILLIALDLSAYSYPEEVSARIMKMLTEFAAPNVLHTEIHSFLRGKKVKPILEALSHEDELVRYWAAITAARGQKSFNEENGPKILDLLLQASDETASHSVLVVSENDVISDTLVSNLKNIGINVYLAKNGYDALSSIRSFPSKDAIILFPNLNTGKLSSLHFVNMLRNDYKGKDIPLAILSKNSNRAQNLTLYQDFAQQLILETDSAGVIEEKVNDLITTNDILVRGKDIASIVNRESLISLENLDPKYIIKYPKVISHMEGIIQSIDHAEIDQLSAIRLLRPFGITAIEASPILLRKLDDDTVPDHYKLEILSTLLKISHSHEGTREALMVMLSRIELPQEFKTKAASYLAGEHQAITSKERTNFFRTFRSLNLTIIE